MPDVATIGEVPVGVISKERDMPYSVPREYLGPFLQRRPSDIH